MSMSDYDDSDWNRNMSGQKCDRCNGRAYKIAPLNMMTAGILAALLVAIEIKFLVTIATAVVVSSFFQV